MSMHEVELRAGEPGGMGRVLDALRESAAYDPDYAAGYARRMSVAPHRVEAQVGGLFVGAVLVETPGGVIGENWLRHVGPGSAELGGLFVRDGYTSVGAGHSLMAAGIMRARAAGLHPASGSALTAPPPCASCRPWVAPPRDVLTVDGEDLVPYVFPA